MSSKISSKIIEGIKLTIGEKPAALHEPRFDASDKAAMQDVIESGFVSSVGPHLDAFEEQLQKYTGAKHAIAVCSGTAALSLALLSNGIGPKQEVLVPAMTFTATGNAIKHAGATPHFIDSDYEHLGVDTKALRKYLEQTTKIKNDRLYNVKTGRVIAAIMPVHIFGHIGNMVDLKDIAKEFKLLIIEDAAEALGSFQLGKHAGTFGECGVISFNGNKIITTGGGGAILTDDDGIAEYARHLATTAKRPHRYEYYHDCLGYNYRMPALNAALGNSQMQKLNSYLTSKQELSRLYEKNFAQMDGFEYFKNPNNSQSNNWLNAIKLKPTTKSQLNNILDDLNDFGYGARPVWALLNTLPHFAGEPSMTTDKAADLAGHLINIPSSPFLTKT